jgi:hypothetical protein
MPPETIVAHGRLIPSPPELGDGWAVVITEPVFAVVGIGQISWLKVDERVRVRFVPGETRGELVLETTEL